MRAGKEIFRHAADDLKLLRLELGGKAPFVVAEDADIGAAVRAAVLSRFENCGQICICNERMYVHERIADEFLDRFVARGEGAEGRRSARPWSTSARSSAAPELDKVERMVEAATAAGAEVLTGGSRLTEGEFARGHWYEPTVLTVADNRMRDHAGRGLRAGRAGDDRDRLRRGAAARQRDRATACRPMSSPRTCAA